MELTVVLVIVALLLGGLLVPLGAQRDIDFAKATDKSLADIREALIGFAVINGRLPCPADKTIASTAANAGVEAYDSVSLSCTCTSSASVPGVASYGAATSCKSTSSSVDSVGGVLPWATLGLLETDAWGNRYTYQVSTFFALGIGNAQGYGCLTGPTTAPTLAAFALCTQGSISILAAAGGTALNTAGTVPALVVSHGKNLLGAYNSLGTQMSTTGAGADETENFDGDDATFVSNTNIDDRLIWIPATQLMNRVIAAGRLP